ncbi:hypothetical protein [Microbacterium album]|uniref:PBP domain-containing protein n=1 Tax=Microbacterium album TaxID=2053191 RepID=A0A917MMD3_9MICO|nr:hypothetical protein [Microbacterium album]GGH47832.1 hypothetical protein GCM10010921_24860 [Microbacterium album]
MKLTKKGIALGAALGLVATLAVGAPAHAEPVSQSYVIAGSDTLQESVNALTNGTTISGANVRVLAGGRTLGNFDAFGSEGIQTKSGGPVFARPGGSGAGVNALRASIDGTTPFSQNTSPSIPAKTIAGQVDIARSSSAPAANVIHPDGKLAWIPFGRDAVAYAYKGDPRLGSLTTAQLRQIYEANGSKVNINGVEVTALIPQSASGTRSFFLSSIGVGTVGNTVVTENNTIPENNGSVLAGYNNVIVPFSAAAWIAQKNGAAGVNTIASDVHLGSPNGVSPTTGTTTLAASSAFYNSSFGRNTYLIAEYARINPADPRYDADLAAVLNPAVPQSLTNFGTFISTAGAVKSRFGFLAPSDTSIIRTHVDG